MGKRRTGKTTLWKNIIPKIAPMYPFVYFFCGTVFNSAFKKYAPKDALIKGYSEALVNKILEAQEQKIEANLRLYERFSQYEDEELLKMIPNPYVHIMFDDTAADVRTHDSTALKEIAMYGRHYRASNWISTQHGHALHPGKLFIYLLFRSIHINIIISGFRNNADVAISYKQVQKNQRETLRDEWLNSFQQFGVFNEWLDYNTQDRNFIAVHAADIVSPWQETIYKGVCDPKVEPLKLGCAKYWEMYGEGNEVSGKSLGEDVELPVTATTGGGRTWDTSVY